MTGSDLSATIKEKIINWQYYPGQAITEKSICDEFKVSRSPVREALQILQADGYIDKIPNKGYTVIQPDPQQTRNLYDYRLALELHSTERLAADGIWTPVIEELYSFWSPESFTDRYDTAQRVELDRNFHESLTRECGNPILLENLRNVNDRLHIFRVLEFTSISPNPRQHFAILEGIKNRDPLKTREAVRENISTAMEQVDEMIKQALTRSFFHQESS